MSEIPWACAYLPCGKRGTGKWGKGSCSPERLIAWSRKRRRKEWLKSGRVAQAEAMEPVQC